MENLSQIDEEFIRIMTDIEKLYISMNKSQKQLIERWAKKLC
jgi:hypothetical protein